MNTRWWRAVDSALCLFIFYPSFVFYWRGIWDLLGVYIFPGDCPKCHWTITGVGAFTIFGYAAFPLLDYVLPREKTLLNKVIYLTVTRLVMFVYGGISMSFWRGVWLASDYYLIQYGWLGALVSFIICYGILLVLQVSKTCIFPPFFTNLDTRPREQLLAVSTRFGTKIDKSRPITILLYIFDSLFTQYFILTVTILTWRHLMCMLDALFLTFAFAGDVFLADVTSLFVGVGLSILLFILEEPMAEFGHFLETKSKSARQTFWIRILYQDVVYFVVFVFEAVLWRGGWNLIATYFIGDQMIGGWINHFFGTVILISVQLLSYASACGCAFDGRDPAREAIFATKYLRHYLAAKEEKQTYAVNATPDPSVDSSATLSSADSHLSISEGVVAMSYSNASSETINDKSFEKSTRLSPNDNNNNSTQKNSSELDRGQSFNTISENVHYYRLMPMNV